VIAGNAYTTVYTFTFTVSAAKTTGSAYVATGWRGTYVGTYTRNPGMPSQCRPAKSERAALTGTLT
jgi:hypothetical protein